MAALLSHLRSRLAYISVIAGVRGAKAGVVHPEKEGAKKEINRKEMKEKKEKNEKTKQKSTCAQGAGRVTAGTISPITFPGDVPTEGRHDNTRRKTRKEKKRAETELKNKNKNKISISMYSWWGKDD